MMRTKLRYTLATLGLSLALVLPGGSVFAQKIGGGCSPDFWKAHPAQWGPTGYSPGQRLSSVFLVVPAGLGASTLMQVLDFRDGGGLEGAVRLLLRAGVAALLNASHPTVKFAATKAEVQAEIQRALASGDEERIRALASRAEGANSRLCPLR